VNFLKDRDFSNSFLPLLTYTGLLKNKRELCRVDEFKMHGKKNQVTTEKNEKNLKCFLT
jgi:hypothetical protein